MKEDFLNERLLHREARGLLRMLKDHSQLVDFCSNDYLGFARSASLWQRTEAFLSGCTGYKNGSGGSRLLAGHSAFFETLEEKLACIHKAESALLFNSGYDANVGLFASVPQRNDLVLYDELIHASVHDGMRLSKAERIAFRHNDTSHLETLLKEAAGHGRHRQMFVAVETLYSMDGDFAPLRELVSLCDTHGAMLIADEAHATGVRGHRGLGLVEESGLEHLCFARLHTFGKALGVHGAVVLGSSLLKRYLVNFARPFIYSTALPLHALASIHAAYEELQGAAPLREKLRERIVSFRNRLEKAALDTTKAFQATALSPVISLIIPGNEPCRQVATSLQQAGFDVRPILSPTVPAGKERLRICIHAFNTEEEIEALIHLLEKTIGRVNSKPTVP